MTSDFTGKLLDLIFSPIGLVGIVVGVVVLEQANRSRRLAWLLLSLFCYASSFGKFKDEWTPEPPTLVFPLQQLRDMGRPLAILLLFALVILGMQTRNGWRRILIAQPIYYLIAFQVAVFFKILMYGDISFGLMALLTFLAIVLMFKLGPCRWLQNEDNFLLGVWSLAMVGVIFGLACAYQGRVDMHAMTFVQGRFLGTTGNAQHAAALLAGTIPNFLFLIERRQKWDLIKGFWIAALLLVAYFLFLTGSRTGGIMTVGSILSFYRNRGGALLRLGTFIGVVSAVVLSSQSPDTLSANAPTSDRFVSGGNTREGAWTGMWNGFMSNILFGSPLNGDRLVFGESSWLAAGDTTGLMGFIPIFMMGLGCLKMIFELHKLSQKKPDYILHSSVVIGGLVGLLAGSFSEALLLGNLSYSVLSLFMYLSLGKYLLDLDLVQNRQQLQNQNRFY